MISNQLIVLQLANLIARTLQPMYRYVIVETVLGHSCFIRQIRSKIQCMNRLLVRESPVAILR